MTRSIGSPDERTVAIPAMDLADTQFVSVRVRVPAGKTLRVLACGVESDTNTAPAGLSLEVDQEDAGAVESNEVSENALEASGSPLGEVDGGKTAAFRVENDTGDAIGASGWAVYRVV